MKGLIILMLLSSCKCFSQYCFVSNVLPQRDTVVQASGYYVLNSGTLTLPTGATFYAISLANRTKIRQAGSIESIKFYLPSKPTVLTSFKFQIWRKDATKYDLIGEEEILCKMVGGVENSIVLDTPIAVIEGDLIGYGYTATSDPGFFLNAVSLSNSGRYVSSEPTTFDFNWTGGTALSRYWPVNVYMKAPVIVGVGHSVVAGHPTHYTYVEQVINPDNPYSSYVSKVGRILNVPVQNMAIGGQGSSTIKNRFAADVVALNPRYVIIDAANADIANNAPNSVIISNYTSMLTMAVNADIIPIVMMVLPWTAATNAQSEQIDSLNISLAALKDSFPTMIKVDARSKTGQFRIGGIEGNYWDIYAPYNADGGHWKECGNTVIADEIVYEIIHNN